MSKDIKKKICLSDDERYADLINGLLFDGKQEVRSTDLQEADSQAFIKFWTKKRKYRQLYRDMLKKTAFGVNFALIGVENQELVHYLMPLRAMEYDVAEYGKQAAKIRKHVKRMKGISRAEFLSGFRGMDKLYPCITLVLYYGEQWDGAKDLYALLDFTDIPNALKQYVNNYAIYVFEISKLDNMDIFKTDLKQIFKFIKHAKDKKELKELVQSDKGYQELAEDAYDMIVECTKAEELIAIKKYHEKDGKVNMCQAIKEMLADERLVGKEEGREEGREEGIEAFVQDYLEEGVTEEHIMRKLVFRFRLSDEKAREYIEKYRIN